MPNRRGCTLMSSQTRDIHIQRFDLEGARSWMSGICGPHRLATATPEPADDPPGERCGSQGLRVVPWYSDCPIGNWPNSGIVVRPPTTAPAARP